MKAGVFNQPGDIVPMEEFARGCERAGLEAVVRDHFHCRGEPYDLVAVGGNLRRLNRMNQNIFEYYRLRGVPVFVIETGRLLKPELGKHWFFYLNHVPSQPEDITGDSSRRDRLFPPVNYKERGEAILFIGQDTARDIAFDVELDTQVAAVARRYTNREIIWRPRGRHNATFLNADQMSRGKSVQEDLARSWAVVTHSSNMGGEALIQGVPVFSDPVASYGGLSHHTLDSLDVAEPPPEEAVEEYLRAMSFICWSTEEMSEGKALKWFLKNVDLTSY